MACPIHYGSEHGGEASELRCGLEQAIEVIGADSLGAGRTIQLLTRLLDRVDARDTLAHEETVEIDVVAYRLGSPTMGGYRCYPLRALADDLADRLGATALALEQVANQPNWRFSSGRWSSVLRNLWHDAAYIARMLDGTVAEVRAWCEAELAARGQAVTP